MKQQSLKKLFVFIIIAMVFSVLPKSSTAQRNCQPGYVRVCDENGKHCSCVKWCYRCSGFSLTATTNSNSSSISFQLDKEEKVSIKIYDVAGQLIKTLTDNKLQQGNYQIQWNSKDQAGNLVPTGIYVLQFITNNKSEIIKLSII